MFRNQRDLDRWYGIDPDTGDVRDTFNSNKKVEEIMQKIDKNSKGYIDGFGEGQDAVRQKPMYAPSNPYDDFTEPEEYEGWEDGAMSAGINDIYTNGVLNKSERR